MNRDEGLKLIASAYEAVKAAYAPLKDKDPDKQPESIRDEVEYLKDMILTVLSKYPNVGMPSNRYWVQRMEWMASGYHRDRTEDALRRRTEAITSSMRIHFDDWR